jgi:hypothetical protein
MSEESWFTESLLADSLESVPSADKKKTRFIRGKGPEAQRVTARIAGFDLEQSEAWKAIVDQFTVGVTHAELKSIADVLCNLTGLKLDRDAQRDNRVLIKWYQENWDALQPHVRSIHLRDEREEKIGAPPSLTL